MTEPAARAKFGQWFSFDKEKHKDLQWQTKHFSCPVKKIECAVHEKYGCQWKQVSVCICANWSL
jgi:hypothetical protein